MQSIFGALLTAGYAVGRDRRRSASSSDAGKVSDSTQSELTKSFDSAEAVAQQYPQYASQITAAAKAAFLDGDQWAYTGRDRRRPHRRRPGVLPVPEKDDENRLLDEYHEEDVESAPTEGLGPLPGVGPLESVVGPERQVLRPGREDDRAPVSVDVGKVRDPFPPPGSTAWRFLTKASAVPDSRS